MNVLTHSNSSSIFTRDPIARKLYDFFGSEITGKKATAVSLALTTLSAEQLKTFDQQLPFSRSATKIANVLAWYLSETSVNSADFIKGLRILCMHSPHESRWLCDFQPRADQLKAVIETNEKVTKNFCRLLAIGQADTSLSEVDFVPIALFTACLTSPKGYFKKEQFGLPRTIHYDRGAAILDNRIAPIIAAAKKVTFGYMLPEAQNLKVEPIARLTNIYKSEEHVVRLQDEATLQKELWQKAEGIGIWDIYSVCTYTKDGNTPKISIIMPQAEGTLSELLFRAPKLPVLVISHQLCHGLNVFHTNGYVHGDLKLENVLYKAFQVGLTDLGFCFKNGSSPLPEIFQHGYYGSIVCSPPEFIANKAFTGDFFKVEMWAFGCLLYPLLFGCEPPWYTVTNKYYKPNLSELEASISPKDEVCFRNMVITEVEDKRALLFAKNKPLSHREALELFVYNCLRLDPNKRFTSQAALEQLTTLCKSVQASHS